MENNIFKSAIQSYRFEEFLNLSEDLLSNNKTSGENQSEMYIHYTKLNLQRMKRWSKTFESDPKIITKIQSNPSQKWWVVTELWCGDSAQNLPLIAKLANDTGIELRIVLRDDNPQVIDKYLTNGSKSIPILVSFNDQDEQLFVWGPRPAAVQMLMAEWKANPGGKTFEDFELELHKWYADNKGVDFQKELSNLLK